MDKLSLTLTTHGLSCLALPGSGSYERLERTALLAAYTGAAGVHLSREVKEYLEGLRRLRYGP
jgi:hypothetical protein